MTVISLLTDFGTEDEYVGLMKGVILSINPQAVVVDITHHIAPQDVIQAAYTLHSSYRYFPEGTLHLVVVDPGVGTDRSIIALEKKGHIFLAPDNGVLSLVFEDGEIGEAVRVENSEFFIKPVSRTFQGRDIFAPTGAHLSTGVALKDLGPGVSAEEIVRLSLKQPTLLETGELQGSIVSIDRFGNLISNIDAALIQNLCEEGSLSVPEIIAGGHRIEGLCNAYAETESGKALAIIGSRGYLEIAVNKASAKRRFNLKRGDSIIIRVKGEKIQTKCINTP